MDYKDKIYMKFLVSKILEKILLMVIIIIGLSIIDTEIEKYFGYLFPKYRDLKPFIASSIILIILKSSYFTAFYLEGLLKGIIINIIEPIVNIIFTIFIIYYNSPEFITRSEIYIITGIYYFQFIAFIIFRMYNFILDLTVIGFYNQKGVINSDDIIG